MVSKSVDARNLETCLALKYCMIYQIHSKSVSCSISATLQHMSCISFLWERHGYLLLNAYNP